MCIPLLKQSHLKSLLHLDLSENSLRDDLIKESQGSPVLQQLQSLSLNDTKISYKTVKYLSRSELSQLTVLDLGNNVQIRDTGVIYLEALLCSNPIQHLNLCRINLTEIGADILANLTGLSSVTHLNLRSNNYVQDAGAKSLFCSQGLANLEFLSLHNCWLTGESVQWLLQMAAAEKVRDIRLSENNIDATGLALFSASLERFPALRQFAGGYFCNEEFPGREAFLAREIELHSYIGDGLD